MTTRLHFGVSGGDGRRPLTPSASSGAGRSGTAETSLASRPSVPAAGATSTRTGPAGPCGGTTDSTAVRVPNSSAPTKVSAEAVRPTSWATRGRRPGSVAGWLSTAVGPTGRVVATDLDVRLLDRLDDRVEVVRHDVTRDPLEHDAFDLVHARAVLEHLPPRDEIVGKLASALRPGGHLVLGTSSSAGRPARCWRPPSNRPPAVRR